MVQIIAHRGFSGRQPEMTRAAYAEAIAWVDETGVPLALECDVQFSADEQLVCLHDRTVDRTSTSRGRVHDHTVAVLKSLDFGSRRTAHPSPDQREMLTLRELMEMVRDARERGLPVGLAIETKHPGAQARGLEQAVADLVSEFDWDRPGSPVTLLSFSVTAMKRFGAFLPALPRTLLVDEDLGPWRFGRLPDGIRIVGVDIERLRADHDFATRVRARGHLLHVWTANLPADIDLCLALGVQSITTDFPDRVAAALTVPAIQSRYSGDRRVRTAS